MLINKQDLQNIKPLLLRNEVLIKNLMQKNWSLVGV